MIVFAERLGIRKCAARELVGWGSSAAILTAAGSNSAGSIVLVA